MSIIVLCAILYVVSGQKPTIASYIFDVYVFSLYLYSLLLTKFRIPKFSFVVIVLSSLIFVVQFLNYKFQSEYFDFYTFLRSSRFIVYIAIFLCLGEQLRILGAGIFEIKLPNYFVKVMLYVFSFFYFFEGILLGADRPALYSENNYEVPSMLLLVVIFLSAEIVQKGGSKYLFMSLLTSVLSKSKSGILEFSAMFLRSYVKGFNIKSLIFLFVLSVFLIPLIGYIFLERMSGADIGDVDRFKFVLVFLELLKNSTVSEVLLGHGVAAVLPFGACVELKYWAHGMFKDYAYCDSVVFHSLIVKQFYDIGLLGVVVYFSIWYWALSRFYGRRLGLTLFLVVLICSLSVSGFSNSIVIWPLFIGLYYQYNVRSRD